MIRHASRRAPLPSYPLVAALILALLLIMMLLFFPVPAHGQKKGSAIRVPRSQPEMLVSGEWLNKHLKDPNLVVLCVGRQRTSYDAGHISGARYVGLGELAVPRNGVPNELPPVADLEKLFAGLGVSDRTRVILYDDAGGLLAARGYFTLDYLGHGDRAALLDGGLESWREAKLPLTQDAPKVMPATFTAKVNPNVLATVADVREVVASSHSGTVLLDARPAEEYDGTKPPEGLRAGHIPGAINLFWQKTEESKENPELLPPADLRKLYRENGVAPGSQVITYCRSGIQASHAYFTAKYLGYDVRMYDGSFSEWSNAPDTKVEKK